MAAAAVVAELASEAPCKAETANTGVRSLSPEARIALLWAAEPWPPVVEAGSEPSPSAVAAEPSPSAEEVAEVELASESGLVPALVGSRAVAAAPVARKEAAPVVAKVAAARAERAVGPAAEAAAHRAAAPAPAGHPLPAD